ncbi:hypothetical protein N7457_007204 [Penicillium paradoxum]|uniref:uncharacterized protein n=1 Tax=Penicillium paradoxum TaxID=176176 RepID=UPI0025473B99|nr:uncharacterized protein N7457_007204 [Penicillium paradoxum]KAJ5779484.1 hypothetical protein N7457_007204 [Penicillium paradoxum]
MSNSEVDSLDLYVGFGQRRANWGLHWILLLASPGSNSCTWYHVIGGPSKDQEYECKIQAGKRMDSFGISKKELICSIPESKIGKVKSAVKAVPLQPCQRWTVEALAKLEHKGLIPVGTSEKYRSQMEPSRIVRTENGWAVADKVPVDESAE